jgi:hypothetical protein
MLTALLNKLAAYKPEVITVENVSGDQCAHLKTYAGLYPGSYEQWCRAPDVAQKAMGMDGPAAAAEAEKALAAWPATPSAGARRRLAALFLAAGDRPSAGVQWLRLAPEERHVGDGVNEDTLAVLERAGAKPNEVFDVAVVLAARLGLERVYLVDDHTSDGSLPDGGKAFDDAITAAWKLAPSKAVAQAKKMDAALATPDDILALYRFLNRPETLRDWIKADMGAALGQQTPQLFGRQYVGAWEVRNLRMVANIRAAFVAHPGARVLNIVGVTHKPYYDAYLNMVHDVKLVDAEQVLN